MNKKKQADQVLERRGVVIGMVHLLPLPGACRYGGSMEMVREAAVRDAQLLVAGGVDAIMMENFGDVPFFPGRVPAETIAAMTSAAAAVKGVIGATPLGINTLRNDGQSALAIAAAVGAGFIRINVLTGARVTDQGAMQGIAHDVLRMRVQLGVPQIRILADVDVKHSAPLAVRPLEDEVDDTVERGLADGLIVSGAGTGKPTDAGKVKKVREAAPHTPIYLGSGVTAETIKTFSAWATGYIVGTSLKVDGDVAKPVDPERVKRVVAAARAGADEH